MILRNRSILLVIVIIFIELLFLHLKTDVSKVSHATESIGPSQVTHDQAVKNQAPRGRAVGLLPWEAEEFQTITKVIPDKLCVESSLRIAD